jgi:outer membrane protein assembly factor BamB
VIRFLLVLLAANLLACSTSTPVHPPAELVDMENKLEIHRVWQRTIGYGASDKYLKFTPLLEDQTGYSIDHEGLVVAWNIADGKVIWQKRYETSAASSIAKDKNHFYFGTSRGEVFALNKAHGEQVWKQQLSSEILSPPVSYAGKVVVRTVDGKIHALAADTGKKLWSHDRSVPTLSLRGTSAPLVTQGIVISGADSGKLTALALDNGNVLWETTISVPRGRNEIERLIDIDAEPVIKDDVIYTVAYHGRLAAVKIDSGRILWVRDISSYAGMAIDSHKIYLTASDGHLWALDRFNGATLWKQDQLNRRQLSKPALQGRYLVVGDFNGYLHWMAREDGRLLARTQLGYSVFDEMDAEQEYIEDERVFSKSRNILATPVITGDTVIAITREGLLSAYRVTEMNQL